MLPSRIATWSRSTKLRLLPLLLMAAACKGDDMPVRRFETKSPEQQLQDAAAALGGRRHNALPPSNWGKSFTTPNPSAENQLVRVALPQSRDLTLFLQPARDSTNGLPERIIDYRVTVGTGGIAVTQSWIPCPVYGVVRHFVADLLEVTVIAPSASVGHPTLVAANAALGRPSDVIEAGSQVGFKSNVSPTPAEMAAFVTKRPTAHGWINVGPGTAFQPLIRIPAYATKMRVEVYNPSGVADANMVTYAIGANGGSFAVEQPLSVFATPQPLAPDAVLMAFRNDGASLYSILVNFDVQF